MCHVLNRVIIRSILEKKSYEILKGKKSNISYFHIFGCKFFILNNGKDNLGNFDAKSDEGIFLGYLSTSKSYRNYNHRYSLVEDSNHISFDESSPEKAGKGICSNVSCIIMEKLINDESSKVDPPSSIKEEDIKEDKEESLHDDDKQEISNELSQDWKIPKDHPLDQILGDILIIFVSTLLSCLRLSLNRYLMLYLTRKGYLL